MFRCELPKDVNGVSSRLRWLAHVWRIKEKILKHILYGELVATIYFNQDTYKRGMKELETDLKKW